MFVPQNDLERSLVSAAVDPAYRPQFYKDFEASSIFFIQYGAAPQPERSLTLTEGTKVGIQPIQKDGKSYLPIFSSLLRLKMFVSQEVSYLSCKTSDFLNLTRGADLLLNPGAEYGKEFTQAEIESILDGSLWQPQKTYTVAKETKVLLGQPQNYPQALVDALARLFRGIKEVDSAYLAHFHNTTEPEPPHTLIGIKTDGNWEAVASQAGIVANSVFVPNPPIDFVKMTGQGDVENYLLTTIPFYKRKP